jgi:hypothetical protein
MSVLLETMTPPEMKVTRLKFSLCSLQLPSNRVTGDPSYFLILHGLPCRQNDKAFLIDFDCCELHFSVTITKLTKRKRNRVNCKTFFTQSWNLNLRRLGLRSSIQCPNIWSAYAGGQHPNSQRDLLHGTKAEVNWEASSEFHSGF